MKRVQVSVDLPEDILEDEAVREAERAGLEMIVIKLWEAAKLSTREASKLLGLTYHEYLDLLATHGVPVERADDLMDEQAFEAIRKQLRLKHA